MGFIVCFEPKKVFQWKRKRIWKCSIDHQCEFYSKGVATSPGNCWETRKKQENTLKRFGMSTRMIKIAYKTAGKMLENRQNAKRPPKMLKVFRIHQIKCAEVTQRRQNDLKAPHGIPRQCQTQLK